MGTVAYHQARALAAAGAQVTVFTPRTASRGCPTGVRSWSCGRSCRAATPPVCRRSSRARALRHRPPPLSVLRHRRVARRAAPPRRTAARAAISDGCRRGVLEGAVFQAAPALMLPVILHAADAIVVTSHDYAASSFLAPQAGGAAAEAGRPRRPGSTWPLLPRGRPRRDPRRLGLPEQPTVFFLARLDRAHYFKGLHVLIEAIAQIPEAALVVGGDGEWRRSTRPSGGAGSAGGSASSATSPTRSSRLLPRRRRAGAAVHRPHRGLRPGAARGARLRDAGGRVAPARRADAGR